MTLKSDDHQNHQDHPISKKSRARFPPGPPVLLCLWAVGCWLLAVGCWLAVVAAVAVVAVVAGVALVAVVVAVVAAVAAAAFGGASGHAAGNGVSSGAGAKKWCCCECISATGAGGAAGVGTDVVVQGFVQHEGMVVTCFHHNWSWSIKLVQFHTGDGLTGDQNDTN